MCCLLLMMFQYLFAVHLHHRHQWHLQHRRQQLDSQLKEFENQMC
jgi:hypothetical protein